MTVPRIAGTARRWARGVSAGPSCPRWRTVPTSWSGRRSGGTRGGAERHVLVRHGAEELPDVPRTYEGLQSWVLDHRHEGVVWHHPDGRAAKVKRKLFVPLDFEVTSRARAVQMLRHLAAGGALARNWDEVLSVPPGEVVTFSTVVE